MKTFHIISGLLALLHFTGAIQQFIYLQSPRNTHTIQHPELLFTLCLCLGLFYTIIFITTRAKVKVNTKALLLLLIPIALLTSCTKTKRATIESITNGMKWEVDADHWTNRIGEPTELKVGDKLLYADDFWTVKAIN